MIAPRFAPGRRRIAIVVATVATAVASACLTPLAAQDRLIPARSGTAGPIFERWSFGTGLRQPASNGSGSVELRTAAAWSVPIAASVGFGERWTFDASTAYSNGTVKLRGPDAALGTDEYALSG